MHAKMRRNFSGEFAATNRGNGAWQLDRAVPHETSVYVHKAEQHAAQAFGTRSIRALNIEWQADAVQLNFTSAGRPATVKALGVIVHEPLASLYNALPLASIDARARLFWRRVFRLIRIPGGRFLLGLLRRSGRH